ncbi:MAG: anthranilate phosphoribosyltransferase [Candidatus Nanopelagicales bacterium]|nr:anthranilate phosphoribosyltransferase [Candidatus Nanopelagicales bacterium]
MSEDITWPQVLRTLIAAEDLPDRLSSWAMEQMLAGEASDAQIAGFVVALRAKGESPAEVAALVATMGEHANTFTTSRPAIDVVGTGGDQANTVNISTMTSLVVAACGVPVAKHGNRAASSQTGTADVLEELGVVIELAPDQVRACVELAGIGFAFAPRHHPAMRHVAQVRRQLGVPTVFNILGPLSNPASAAAMLLGVADARRAPVIARVLADRGVRALVVRGDDGLDELSTTTTSTVWDVTRGTVDESSFDPSHLGLLPVDPALLVGGDRVRNAELLRQVIGSEPVSDHETSRIAAIRDVVCLNAAAALTAYAALHEPVVDAPLHDRVGVHLPSARAALESGEAAAVLARWISTSQRIAQQA